MGQTGSRQRPCQRGLKRLAEWQESRRLSVVQHDLGVRVSTPKILSDADGFTGFHSDVQKKFLGYVRTGPESLNYLKKR